MLAWHYESCLYGEVQVVSDSDTRPNLQRRICDEYYRVLT